MRHLIVRFMLACCFWIAPRIAICCSVVSLRAEPFTKLQARESRTVGPNLEIDSAILSEIMKIKAFDNHAHPMKIVLKGEKPDQDYDALPVDAMQPFDLPTRIRPDNPLYIHA